MIIVAFDWWLNSDIGFCSTENAFPQVMIVPVPVPVYVPLPMNMYTQCTARPLCVPLPVGYCVDLLISVYIEFYESS